MSISSFDILSYLDDKSIWYSTEGKNISQGWIGLQCPFCGDTSNHLGINVFFKSVSCWRCGKHSVVEFIRETENCNYHTAERIISKYQDRTLSHIDKIPERHLSELPVTLPKQATKTIPPPHKSFLLSRNFDPDTLYRKYDLYSCYTTGKYKYRIIAPIYMKRELTGYVARDVTGEAEIRYKNSPIEESKVSVKDSLYNIDTVKDTAIVVEGITDAWRIGDGAVATMGTKFTMAQIAMLRGIKNVFIMFDSDAKEQAEKLGYELTSVSKHVAILELEEGDPAELDSESVSRLRHEVFGRL